MIIIVEIIVDDVNICSNLEEKPSDDYVASVNNPDGFRIGDFIVARQDALLDCPAIWRVDSKTLLQKFEPFHINNKTLYRSLSTVSLLFVFLFQFICFWHKPSHARIIHMKTQHNYTSISKRTNISFIVLRKIASVQKLIPLIHECVRFELKLMYFSGSKLMHYFIAFVFLFHRNYLVRSMEPRKSTVVHIGEVRPRWPAAA